MKHRSHKHVHVQQQRIARQAQQCTGDTLFNLLTSNELLTSVEESAGEYRERLYPPAQTLAMFLAQALNADRSCQYCVFRAMPVTDSAACRSVIPRHAGR